MEENFLLLRDRVLDALEVTEKEALFHQLKKISGPTIFAGAGGSRVVAEFAKLVLEKKNSLLGISLSLRDIHYLELKNYQNLFIVSYKGENQGVKEARKLSLTRYLFTSKREEEGYETLSYQRKIKEEKSFISLATTLIPISLLLDYYQSNILPSFLKEEDISYPYSITSFEIFTGIDTMVAATFLESTIVEAGLGTVILHDKYDYCHGRSTYGKKSCCIYLLQERKDLDNTLLQVLEQNKRKIILLSSSSKDSVIGQYQLLLKSMFLTREIARREGKDLSDVKYDFKIVPTVYHFEGEM